jgi:hypothetical protein
VVGAVSGDHGVAGGGVDRGVGGSVSVVAAVRRRLRRWWAFVADWSFGVRWIGRTEWWGLREFDWFMRLHYAEHLRLALEAPPVWADHGLHVAAHRRFAGGEAAG